jgi:DNA repair exonuclease SbcCD ATPase subunit
MNNLDWRLIGFLIIISGIIAFIGNYVGRRVGKRRVSIIGIRPYWTSMIITIITGMVITTVTILVIVNVSEDMRGALENKAKLQESVNILTEKLRATQSELNIRASELVAAVEYQNKLKGTIEKQSSKVTQLEKQRDSLEKQLKERGVAFEESKNKLKELESQRADLALKITNLDKERALLEKEISNLKFKLENAEKEMGKLGVQRKLLLQQVEEDKAELERYKEEIKTYRKEAENLKKEIASKEEKLALLRRQRILFQGGEVLVAETINGPKGEEDAKEVVEDLIKKAEEIIKARYEQINESPPKIDSLITYNPSDVEFAIKSLREPQRLIRIRIVNNTLVGEEVRLVVESLKSKLVFKRNELIAFRFISSKLPRDRIIDEINLLLEQVKKESLKRGMIPDPITGSIGDIPYETILNLAVRIKVQYSKVGSALVVTKSNKDIYTAGPIDIKFELR